MNCPLCLGVSSIRMREYSVDALRKSWKKDIGIDPLEQSGIGLKLQQWKCANCDLVYYHPALPIGGEFYSKLSQFPWYYETDKWEFEEGVKIVKEAKPESLLEVGCGDGHFLEKVTGLVPHAEGIDINGKAMETCRFKGLCASLTAIEDIKQCYDMILLFEVLEHFQDIGGTVEALVRALNPGGLLVIAVPNPDGYLRNLDLSLLDLPPHHNFSFSKQTFDFLEKAYSLELLKYSKEPLRYIHYLTYLSDLARKQEKMEGGGIKKAIVARMRHWSISLFAPFFYTRDKQYLDGQTHLAVFKKRPG